MKRILVRADDLGYCEAVNYGIAEAVNHGIIRSVGLMPNMEAAKHGVDLLKDSKVCYGVHTNICNGRPLTDPAKVPSLVQENGEFKTTREYRESAKKGVDFVVYEEVLLEVEAQYLKLVELTGQQPGYFEGHAVPSANFDKAMREIAAKYGIPYLGGPFGGPVKFKNTYMIMSMDSMFENYDPFESLKKAALKEVKENECVMMVCHPGYVDNYVLTTSFITVQRAQEAAMASDPKTKAWLEENQVEVVTYDELD